MVAPFKRVSTHIPVFKSGKDCHHFFIVNKDFIPLCNKEEQIFVFLSHDKAKRFADRSPILEDAFFVVGMGDTKWEIFQHTEAWTLVEDK